MHINEQSPPTLKKQLLQHFEHVLLWFAEPGLPGGSLLRDYRIRELREANSLFALASHRPISREAVESLLQMEPLPCLGAEEIAMKVLGTPSRVQAEERFSVQVEIVNHSPYPLTSFPPHPVHISYHWLQGSDGRMVIRDGLRTQIAGAASAG